jgi:hypothetical protein
MKNLNFKFSKKASYVQRTYSTTFIFWIAKNWVWKGAREGLAIPQIYFALRAFL